MLVVELGWPPRSAAIAGAALGSVLVVELGDRRRAELTSIARG